MPDAVRAPNEPRGDVPPDLDPTVQVELAPPVPLDVEVAEEMGLKFDPNWRRRRGLITTGIFVGLWFLMLAFVQTGTPPIVYAVLLAPFYLITLYLALRTPKRFRPQKRRKFNKLSFTNRLALTLLTFIAVYIPFTFISDKIIPWAPLFEFFLFLGVLLVLYYLIGRGVGVAPSTEALPPATHRLHKQVVLPIDDPHYQRTLFLNFEFVDRGRGGRTLAKRIDQAMEAVGVLPDRRNAILDDLVDYHEGFRWGFGLTRRGRERRRSGRERRTQVLRTVYTKLNHELEQNA